MSSKWAVVLVALMACAAPHRHPVVPLPLPASHPVACWTYGYGLTPTDFAALDDLGVTHVMDYDTINLCERSKDFRGRLIWPVYYGQGVTLDTIEPVTQAAVRELAPCREHVGLLYPFDEPTYVKPEIVRAVVASAQQALPGLPTLVTYAQPEANGPDYGQTYRGIEFYARGDRDLERVRARLASQQGRPVVLVPRAFQERGTLCCDGAFGTWTDAETAQHVTALVAEAQRWANVVAVMPYTFAEPTNILGQVVQIGWRDLPVTRAAMAAACHE